MRITNKMELPEPIVQACTEHYRPTKNRYGVTSLLKGATQVVLQRRHHDEIENDASSMVWSLFGKAVHEILEKAETPGVMKEMRVELLLDGSTISGVIDLYNPETGKITDYKTASVWKVIHNDFQDYENQVGLYGWLLTELGYKAEAGEIVSFLKDHSKLKAKIDKTYPQFPVHRKEFPITAETNAKYKAMAEEKLREIKTQEHMPDYCLPGCTPEERWNTGDKWAVMKKGAKRALKLFDAKEAAEAYLKTRGDFIEARPGEDKRCEEYCSVAQWCPLWRSKHEADHRQG